MKKKFPWLAAMALFILCMIISSGRSYHAQAAEEPVIEMEETSHTFPPSFEGVDLSHTFMVSNKGTADLLIKKVTTS